MKDFFNKGIGLKRILLTFVQSREIMFKTKKYFAVKHFPLIFIVFVLFSFSSRQVEKEVVSTKKISRIVIDAGHGGHDPGACGKKSKEKDITLQVALYTGKMIQTHCSGVEVFYTRDTDVFVELYNRAKIANEKNADVFISIHCNGSTRKEASGSEFFVMGLDKSEQNLEIAKKENASILLESDYEAQYEGIDPNSSEAYIAFSLFQHTFLEQSANLASFLMNTFKSHVGLTNRGVKQAPFLVLWRTAMPSVLIEIGFISNPTEEEFLMKDENKKKIAYSIYKAFVQYKNTIEGTSTPIIEFSKILPDVTENTSVVDPIKTDTGNTTTTSAIDPKGVTFSVQLFIDPILLPESDEKFKGQKGTTYYQDAGYYKYISGSFTTFAEATEHQKKMKQEGFAEAFVVAFNNKTRIDVKEARRVTENK